MSAPPGVTIRGDRHTHWGAASTFTWVHDGHTYTAQIIKNCRKTTDGEETTVADKNSITRDHAAYDDRADAEVEIAWRDNEVYPARRDLATVGGVTGMVMKVEDTWGAREFRGCRVTVKRFDGVDYSAEPASSESSESSQSNESSQSPESSGSSQSSESSESSESSQSSESSESSQSSQSSESSESSQSSESSESSQSSESSESSQSSQSSESSSAPSPHYRLVSVDSIISGGTGYAVNDKIYLWSGYGGQVTRAQCNVDSVTDGVITALSIDNVGDYTPAFPEDPVSFDTNGSGQGGELACTFEEFSP